MLKRKFTEKILDEDVLLGEEEHSTPTRRNSSVIGARKQQLANEQFGECMLSSYF